MYLWRQLDEAAREELLKWRREHDRPWHSPPHRESRREQSWLFTAACYEHAPHVGFSLERMAAFEEALLEAVRERSASITAWAVLPNHYHVLARTTSPRGVLAGLGKLHGSTAFRWNAEEGKRGRQVWCRAAETEMKSERHFLATVNYLHHNPVKHGYVTQWQDWPFSSARAMLESVGRDEAMALWREYPVGDYGKGWDD